MHFTKALTTSLYLASLASCSGVAARSDNTDITKRGRSDELDKRQAPPGPNDERVVQIVTVGNADGALKFFPESIKADVGSVVQFQFWPKNHTITESTFANPCVPMPANISTPERPGQKSGFVPVAADTQFRPIYNMIVNDTKPMWLYCGQAPHCQRGMVMVINQNETDPEKTLEKYKENAAKVPLPSGAAPPSTRPASSDVTPSAPAASTVTPPAATSSGPAGPSLSGSTTSAIAQNSGTAAPTIATYTGAAVPRQLPAMGSLLGLAGLVGVML